MSDDHGRWGILGGWFGGGNQTVQCHRQPPATPTAGYEKACSWHTERSAPGVS